jgi:exopolyphosphatase/pppGpp-phosphohydrolase
MEWWLIGLGVIAVLAILNKERQAGSIRRDLARLDRKLNRILEQMNIPYDEFAVLSDRVKEMARDPSRKIEAIKVYREETGAGLAEAKEIVEAFIQSLQR